MASGDATHGGDSSVRQAAANAYVRCFPLYLTDAVRRSHPIAPAQFHLAPLEADRLAPGLAEDDPRVVICSAWIDLSAGPVVLRIPHTHGRHLSLTVVDTAGRCLFSGGSRTGDDDGLDLVLVAPRWMGEVPPGVRARRSSSDSCWAVSRIHAHSMLDRSETIALARHQSITPLHDETDLRAPADAMLEPLTASCLQQVRDLAPDQFFQRLNAVLERAPMDVVDACRESVAWLRGRVGEPLDSEQWDAPLIEALAKGFADGVAAIQAATGSVYASQGVGWRTLAATPDPKHETALQRAAGAYESLGAPAREDRLTLICDRDVAGRILFGRNAYRIRLPSAALPPANDFWRLYARPAAGAQYRTGIGSHNDLLSTADGSLELAIQHALPEMAGMANWLPAPEGELALVMTLHSPRPAALQGAWLMAAVERLDPGTRQGGSRQRRRPPTPGGGYSNGLRMPLPEERSDP